MQKREFYRCFMHIEREIIADLSLIKALLSPHQVLREILVPHTECVSL